MLFQDCLLEAMEILDQMFTYNIKSRRIKVCPENMALIEELQAGLSMWHPNTMSWTVMGEVNSGLAYFVLHYHSPDPMQGGGKVIQVNFRPRKAVKRAA